MSFVSTVASLGARVKAWHRLNVDGTDSSGGGLTLGVSGGYAFGTGSLAGDSDQALYVGGGASANAADSGPLYSLNRDFSLWCRFYLNSTSGAQCLISHGPGGWYLRAYNGKLEFLKSNVALIATGNATLSTGVWYTGSVSVDSSGNYDIRVNGVSDKTGNTSHNFTGAAVTYYVAGESGENLDGRIDEPMIVASMLSGSEDLALHNAAIGASSGMSASLLAEISRRRRAA